MIKFWEEYFSLWQNISHHFWKFLWFSKTQGWDRDEKEERKNKILRRERKGKGLGKKDKEAGKHISPTLYFARTGLTIKYKDLHCL